MRGGSRVSGLGGDSVRGGLLSPAPFPPVATGICGGGGCDGDSGKVSDCSYGGGGGIAGGSGKWQWLWQWKGVTVVVYRAMARVLVVVRARAKAVAVTG